MDLFVTRAESLAQHVTAADSPRAFRSAVDHFESLLSRISHYPPDFLTDGEYHALATLADTVVNRIEDRLDTRADRDRVQRELALQIYQVRRDLENIYMVLHNAPDHAAPA